MRVNNKDVRITMYESAYRLGTLILRCRNRWSIVSKLFFVFPVYSDSPTQIEEITDFHLISSVEVASFK